MAKDWIDAAIEFYDVMRRKTEEENARRALACPHNFIRPDLCPICKMHARLRDEEYNARDDFAKSIEEAYTLIRKRKAAGGEGWEPK
jgi:hypothetical protein